VSLFGTLYLTLENGTIYRHLHLEEQSFISSQLDSTILNTLLPAFSQFSIILLIGNMAEVKFAYCHRDLEETMTKRTGEEPMELDEVVYDDSNINPLFIARQLYFYYGPFVDTAEAPIGSYQDSTFRLRGSIRNDADNLNRFQLKEDERIHVYSEVHLRITGTGSYLHITKSMIDSGEVKFVTGSNDRDWNFHRWLKIKETMSLPDDSPEKERRCEFPVMANPMKSIPFE